MKDNKNSTLELLKLLASYMVVFIHVLFPGKFGVAVDAIARFAVPFFFLISGFYSTQITTSKIRQRIWSAAKLFLIAAVCFTLFRLANFVVSGDVAGIRLYFAQYRDPMVLAKLFFLNCTLSSVHLWYLLAIIYVYFFLYLATKLRVKENIIIIVAICILAVHLLMEECLPFFGVSFPAELTRNFVFMGIPFFSLGLLAKKQEDKLRSVPNYIVVLAAALGILESVLSRFLGERNELYLGSLLITFALTVVFIKYSHVKFSRAFDFFSGCSTYIYIFHLAVSFVLSKAISILRIPATLSLAFRYASPILVCIITTVLAHGIVRISKRLVSKKKPQQLSET